MCTCFFFFHQNEMNSYVGMYVALSSFHEEFKSQFVVGTAYGNRPNFFSRAHLETRPKSFKKIPLVSSFYKTEYKI